MKEEIIDNLNNQADKTNQPDKTDKANQTDQADKTDKPEKVSQPDNADQPKEHEPLSLKEVIQEQATEDEAPMSRTFSLKKILGGDILSTTFVRRQVWLFLLIAFFVVIYIANRYSCQNDLIEIDKLQKELENAKYKALSSNSKLTEKSRESNVLDILQATHDSTLKLPTQPPYIITVPEK